MSGPLHRVERDRHARPPQRRLEQFALMMRHERILVAMTNQKRRIARGDVRDGIRPRRQVPVLLDRAADQLRLGRVRRIMFHAAGQAVRVHLEKIGRPKIVHHRRTRLD